MRLGALLLVDGKGRRTAGLGAPRAHSGLVKTALAVRAVFAGALRALLCSVFPVFLGDFVNPRNRPDFRRGAA